MAGGNASSVEREVMEMFLRERERALREREECLRRFDAFCNMVESWVRQHVHASNQAVSSSDGDEQQSGGGDGGEGDEQQASNDDALGGSPSDADPEPVEGDDPTEQQQLPHHQDEEEEEDESDATSSQVGIHHHGSSSHQCSSDGDDDDSSFHPASPPEGDDGDHAGFPDDCQNPAHRRIPQLFDELKWMFRGRLGDVSTWGKQVPSLLAPFVVDNEGNDGEEDDEENPEEEQAAAEVTQEVTHTHVEVENDHQVTLDIDTATTIIAAAPPNMVPVSVNDPIQVLARYINSGQCRRIVVMSGAGVSVAAGIPDFRSPGTGLYDNLEKYNLPEPEAVFDIRYFRSNPDAFYMLAKELWPDQYQPTACHRFVRRLHDRGLLLRNYTQNIDTLERVAGVPADKLVEAHGSFGDAECIDCKTRYPSDEVRARIMASERPLCKWCQGLVKPCITFFGESLPKRFKDQFIWVDPFATLIHRVPRSTPRVLINLHKAGENRPSFSTLGIESGFRFCDQPDLRWNRDIFLPGDCQQTIEKLERALKWD